MRIKDNDHPTGISIRSPLKSNYIEGETIQFEVLTDRPVAFLRRINLSITETSGNFVTPSTNRTPEIELLAQSDRVILNVYT